MPASDFKFVTPGKGKSGRPQLVPKDAPKPKPKKKKKAKEE